MVHLYAYRCYGKKPVDGAGDGSSATGGPPAGLVVLDETLAGLQDLYEGEEKVDAPIHEAFAKLINTALRRRPGEEAMKTLMSSHPRPENVPNLVVPRTNPEVFESLRRGSAILDGFTQKVQGMLARALMVDTVGVDATAPLE